MHRKKLSRCCALRGPLFLLGTHIPHHGCTQRGSEEVGHCGLSNLIRWGQSNAAVWCQSLLEITALRGFGDIRTAFTKFFTSMPLGCIFSASCERARAGNGGSSRNIRDRGLSWHMGTGVTSKGGPLSNFYIGDTRAVPHDLRVGEP